MASRFRSELHKRKRSHVYSHSSPAQRRASMQTQRTNKTRVWMQGPGGKRLLYTMADGCVTEEDPASILPSPSVRQHQRESKVQKLSHTAPNAADAARQQRIDAALSMLCLTTPAPPPPPFVHAPAPPPVRAPSASPMRWYFATPRPSLPPLSDSSLPRPLLPLPFPPVASLPYDCPPYLYPAPRLPFKAPQSTPRAIAQRPASAANPRPQKHIMHTVSAIAPKPAERSVPEVTRMVPCNHQ